MKQTAAQSADMANGYLLHQICPPGSISLLLLCSSAWAHFVFFSPGHLLPPHSGPWPLHPATLGHPAATSPGPPPLHLATPAIPQPPHPAPQHNVRPLPSVSDCTHSRAPPPGSRERGGEGRSAHGVVVLRVGKSIAPKIASLFAPRSALVQTSLHCRRSRPASCHHQSPSSGHQRPFYRHLRQGSIRPPSPARIKGSHRRSVRPQVAKKRDDNLTLRDTESS